MMRYLIGTDEAGYGPNLGPLVVSASCWQTTPESSVDLYQALRGVIRKAAPVKSLRTHLPVADSKLLYKPQAGLAALELTVLSMLAAIHDDLPDCWREIISWLDPSAAAELDHIPWYADYDERLPVACHADDVLYWRDRLRRRFAACGSCLTGIASRVVFAGQFNQLLDEDRNKSTSLSQITLALARDVSAPLGEGSIQVHCDKHGGRNRYGRLLQQTFPEYFVEVYDESRESSLYRFGPSARRHEVRFSARADGSSLPTALASMVSKYVRELAMRAFNSFWQQHQTDLRPTAGYPQDARRFLADILPVKTRLDIPDHLLWRAR